MYTTLQAAKLTGVAKNTLLGWINLGLVEDAGRDWRGWRCWSEEDIRRVKAFRKHYHSKPLPRVRRSSAPKAEYVGQAAESMARYGRGRKSTGGNGS